MNEDAEIGRNSSNLILIGKRAVNFQEFLLRRAWAFFYGVWAIDFLLNVIGSFFFTSYADAIFSLVTIISGYFVSISIFSKTRKIRTFRNYIKGSGENRPSILRRVFFGALIAYSLIIVVLVIHASAGKTADYISEFSFLAIIFIASVAIFTSSLRGLGKVSIESTIATSSLLVGGFLVDVFSVYVHSGSYEILIWGLIISAWITSALVSFYNASEVLGGLDE